MPWSHGSYGMGNPPPAGRATPAAFTPRFRGRHGRAAAVAAGDAFGAEIPEGGGEKLGYSRSRCWLIWV